MSPEEMKSAWSDSNQPVKKQEELGKMTTEKNHPVLSRIRKQLIIEVLAFTAFLVVYYDFFDGERKPLYAHIFLVSAALTAVFHNIILYRFTRQPFTGATMKDSLHGRLFTLKTQGKLSVALRALWATCLLIFFSSGIVFNNTKYLLLAGGIACIVVQLIILYRIWLGRSRRIAETLSLFEAKI